MTTAAPIRAALHAQLLDIERQHRAALDTERNILRAAQERLKTVNARIEAVRPRALLDDRAADPYRALILERGALHQTLALAEQTVRQTSRGAETPLVKATFKDQPGYDVHEGPKGKNRWMREVGDVVSSTRELAMDALKMPDLITQIDTIEKSYRKQSVEMMAAIDDDGTILYTAKGDLYSVSIPKKEMKNLIGKTVTHYHPVVTSFSTEDIEKAAEYSLKEIRAVDDEYIYVMRPSLSGWSKDVWDKQLKSDFEKIESEVFGDFFDRLNRGEISQQTFNRELYHVIWERFSKVTGVLYERKQR